jgi:hypothetical protein
MLCLFLRGELPWSGLAAPTEAETLRKIKEKKIEVPIDQLPSAVRTYLRYVRTLKFSDRPNYTFLRQMFHEEQLRAGVA